MKDDAEVEVRRMLMNRSETKYHSSRGCGESTQGALTLTLVSKTYPWFFPRQVKLGSQRLDPSHNFQQNGGAATESERLISQEPFLTVQLFALSLRGALSAKS